MRADAIGVFAVSRYFGNFGDGNESAKMGRPDFEVGPASVAIV